MKNGRNQTDVISIERSLGLKSERGISRQSNKESPPVEAALKVIKDIQTAFVDKELNEIRSSQALRDHASALFETYGPEIWPGPDHARPAWLEEPSDDAYGGVYPQRRHYTNAEDREFLRELFIQLIIEKSTNYHENQLQKRRRLTAKQLDNQNQEGDAVEMTEVLPSKNVNNGIVEDMEPPEPAGFDKARYFQEQFSAYTSPVPADSVPHGLPLVNGVYAQPKSRSGSVQHRETGQKRLPDPATSYNGPSKRARTSTDPLIVTLKVGSNALDNLAQSNKILPSGPSFTSINNIAPSTNGDVSSDGGEDHDTIRVKLGKGKASTSVPPDTNRYVSPYARDLPYTEHHEPAQGHQESAVRTMGQDLASRPCSSKGSRATITNPLETQRLVDRIENPQHASFRADTSIPPPHTPMVHTAPMLVSAPGTHKSLASEILGDLALCPVAQVVLRDCPDLTQVKLQNLKAIFEDYPETQTDLTMLDKCIRDVLQDLRPERPPATQLTWAHTTLPKGTALQSPVEPPAKKFKPNPPIPPMTFEQFQKQNPLPEPIPPPRQTPTQPVVTPKREPSESKEMDFKSPKRSLDDIEVEIEWGRGMEFSDHMELKDFDTVKELFDVIESYRPDELSNESIKEVRVKTKKELHGGNVLPRICKDEGRGRASVRHLIKKMRSQPLDQEIELVFLIVWETVTGA